MISYQLIHQQPIRNMSNSILCHFHDDLKIDLESSEILLLDQATNKPLKGKIRLIPDKPMNVRSIKLIFYGKMKVSWVEGTTSHHHHKQEKVFFEHVWQFVPYEGQPQKKTYLFAPGVHSFDFELQLPQNLPQSLEVEGGQITYRLKAIVERTAFVHNIVKKRDVQIIRCMLPSELQCQQTLEIHNAWAERMQYDIVIPSKVYACGTKIPIIVQITPLASDFKIHHVSGALKELCKYSTTECSKESVAIIQQLKLDNPFADMDVWTKEFELEIPSLGSRQILCDADNDLIQIRHKLEFVIALQGCDGQQSELRCSLPIIIVCSTCQLNNGNDLPTYNQSSRSTLCMATPMNSENSLLWHGIDILRVPSYRTVASQHSALSASPEYDQLIAVRQSN